MIEDNTFSILREGLPPGAVYLVGGFTVTFEPGLWAEEGVGVNLPIVGYVGKSWSQDIYKPGKFILARWEFLRKRL